MKALWQLASCQALQQLMTSVYCYMFLPVCIYLAQASGRTNCQSCAGAVLGAISSMQPADPQLQPLRQASGLQPSLRPSVAAASSLCQAARRGAVRSQQPVAHTFQQAVLPRHAPHSRGGFASAVAASAAAPQAAGTALRSDAAVGLRKRVAPPSLLPLPSQAWDPSAVQRRLAEAAMPPRKVLKYDWTQERR